ncbi:MAG: hypothetical protein K8T25_25040 [Planctomycetia bacterium]|nr:hypothetical protein [Planctomycetia bacterium]
MSATERTQEYETYRGLPPIAGLCSMAEAHRQGLGVGQCVGRLKRFHYALKRLHEICIARLTAEPIYELKTALSLHAHLAAEHATALAGRVAEMREPPLGLDEVPHPALALYFDEIRAAPDTGTLVLGLYGIAVPELIGAMDKYRAESHPLCDAPSRRLLRFALLELEDMAAFGRQAVAALVDDAARDQRSKWVELLVAAMEAAGGLDGSSATSDALPVAQFSATPFQFDLVPRRDERFVDSYNAGVNPEAFLYDPRFSARDKTLMMFYKRLREIDVPEMMASIIHQTSGKPWEFYRAMTRQLWDEARHAIMGEVGFTAAGIDWRKVPINFTWSLNLNTQLTPVERHAVLYFIEQGLMPRNGKRFEFEVGEESGDPLSALFQDFDWADEVLHSQIGRRWYVEDFRNSQQAKDYGDACWSRVVSHWRRYLDEGLTEHRNWWPELYREACRRWGVEPDPQALAFNTTYEVQRADLKPISASG